MPLITVLQHDPTTRARLRRALADVHELDEAESWDDLWESLHKRRVAGCIVDVHDPFRPIPLRELLRLRRRDPPIAIVCYSDFTGRELELFELGRHKIDGVILAGAGDTLRVIRETVDHALGSAVASRVAWTLSGRLPPLALDALRWSVEHAHRSPGVAELAAALTHSPRTLARELRRHGLPTPRRTLLWGRLFRAAHLLEAAERTVEEVAFTLGYASGTGLSRAFRRETGHPPTEVMRKGGVAWVLETFQRSRSRQRRPTLGRRMELPAWARGR